MDKNKLIEFICTDYCQFCENQKCNMGELQEKYQRNELTAKQMEEVAEFELVECRCKNHVPNEGFTMFGHIIAVHYIDGRVEKKQGWFSSESVSELWARDNMIDYIEVIFTDV